MIDQLNKQALGNPYHDSHGHFTNPEGVGSAAPKDEALKEYHEKVKAALKTHWDYSKYPHTDEELDMVAKKMSKESGDHLIGQAEILKSKSKELVKTAAKEMSKAGGTELTEDDNAIDISKWKSVGGQLGSNPGGTFETPAGEKYYVKFSPTADHAKNEHLASKLYNNWDSNAVPVSLIKLNGKLGVATKWMSHADFDPNIAKHNTEASKAFAHHAWLANWDVAGAGGMRTSPTYRIPEPSNRWTLAGRFSTGPRARRRATSSGTSSTNGIRCAIRRSTRNRLRSSVG